MIAGAVLSANGRYRYQLWRDWRGQPTAGALTVCWVMLNPSTADAQEDDATIRRCLGFTRRWGFGRLDVINLFAYRATDPKALTQAVDPIGPAWMGNTRTALSRADMVVCAWGAHSMATRRAPEVIPHLMQMTAERGAPLYALGFTKDGQPRHPLYMPLDATPEPYFGRRTSL
jgi:hypothetical protein